MPRTLLIAILTGAILLSGCAVVAVTSTAVGLAADAAVGAVRITGKAVGAAADLAIPSSE